MMRPTRRGRVPRFSSPTGTRRSTRSAVRAPTGPGTTAEFAGTASRRRSAPGVIAGRIALVKPEFDGSGAGNLDRCGRTRTGPGDLVPHQGRRCYCPGGLCRLRGRAKCLACPKVNADIDGIWAGLSRPARIRFRTAWRTHKSRHLPGSRIGTADDLAAVLATLSLKIFYPNGYERLS